MHPSSDQNPSMSPFKIGSRRVDIPEMPKLSPIKNNVSKDIFDDYYEFTGNSRDNHQRHSATGKKLTNYAGYAC